MAPPKKREHKTHKLTIKQQPWDNADGLWWLCHCRCVLMREKLGSPGFIRPICHWHARFCFLFTSWYGSSPWTNLFDFAPKKFNKVFRAICQRLTKVTLSNCYVPSLFVIVFLYQNPLNLSSRTATITGLNLSYWWLVRATLVVLETPSEKKLISLSLFPSQRSWWFWSKGFRPHPFYFLDHRATSTAPQCTMLKLPVYSLVFPPPQPYMGMHPVNFTVIYGI